MGMLVPGAIAPLFHRSGGSVAELEGHWLGHVLLHRLHHPVKRLVGGVGLGRDGQVDGQLRERQVALGDPQKMDGLHGGDGLFERARIGQADVFDRHTHQPAGDIHAVLARFQHAAQPIKRGIHIARSDGFVERGNQVEMLFAGFVVEQDLALQRVFDRLACEEAVFRSGRGEFQNIERGTRVAVRIGRDLP